MTLPIPPTFIVRADHRWFVTDRSEGIPRAATLADVLESVNAGSLSTELLWSGPGALGDVPLESTGTALATPLVGAAGGGHLAIEGSEGDLILLDDEDIRLIDECDLPGGWGLGRSGTSEAGAPDDTDRRLDRMRAAGFMVTPVADHIGVHEGIEDPAPTDDDRTEPGLEVRVADGGPTGRIPVYAPWHESSGPLLSLGMLTAAARHHDGGRLADIYEIRRPETGDDVLADLAGRDGPAVLLCSNYVWSLKDNLDLARAARTLNPEILVIHGGPSTPKYDADAERFLSEHSDIAHILARGEGEDTLCELLDEISGQLPTPDPDTLAGVSGLTFTDPRTRDVIRTPDRERIADLDRLPSPYLTGEFDHIDPTAWNMTLAVETNRGCPYGCTFCDWGSSTMSRIRKFDIDRVTAELDWAAQRGVTIINIPDANFGIMSRDVEIARRLADIKNRTGHPHLIGYYPAKNTTKHLAAIMDIFMTAGIGPSAPLSLQSTDAVTLEAIDRSNISNDHFVALAAEMRRQGLPLQGELILGLPGQSVDAYKADLQFLLDHEITPRTWPLQLLPNAPMNDPDYRREHQLVVDDDNVVISTSAAGPDDRRRMIRLRNTEAVTERYGLLRHVMRHLQWDHHIPATDVMEHLIDVTDTQPDRYPILTWTLANYDLHPAPPIGWTAFYTDVRRFLIDTYDLTPDTALDTVIALQHFLMAAPGRRFPATLTLTHDYLTYYRSATANLTTTGHADTPDRPLIDHPPATFTITADPLHLCTNGLRIAGDSRHERLPGDFVLGANSANELLSPLIRHLPWVAANAIPSADLQLPRRTAEEGAPADAGTDETAGVRVELRG